MSSSRSAGKDLIRARSARHQRSQTNTYYLTFDLSRTVFVRSPRVISYGRRKSDICDSESGIVTRPGRGLAAQRGGKSWRMTIIEDLPGQGPPVDSSHPTGPAL